MHSASAVLNTVGGTVKVCSLRDVVNERVAPRYGKKADIVPGPMVSLYRLSLY
jgi:hypothetical protein